jgi:hypothetical protein
LYSYISVTGVFPLDFGGFSEWQSNDVADCSPELISFCFGMIRAHSSRSQWLKEKDISEHRGQFKK